MRRPSISLAAAGCVILGCGGGTGPSAATYTVGGTITGLSGTVVLENNSVDTLHRSTNGPFTFSARLADNAAYDVSVRTEPATQTCSVSNGSGNIAGASVSNVAVSCAAAPPVTGIVINEVDYDQPGTDLGEFIELFNPTSAPVNLTNAAVVLISGTDSAEYARVSLTGLTIPAGGYLVIADSGVTIAGGATVIRFATTSNSIQNGKAGIALFDTSVNAVVDALSYGGSITKATITGAPGTYNLVEGTATSGQDSNTSTMSLGRHPNGTDTNNASADWTLETTPSPGAANP